MKKSKLLISLIGTSAIVSSIAPMVLMTSCNKKQATISKIEASSSLGNIVYEGVIVRRSDITVTATMSDNTTKTITDWKCEKFVDNQYVIKSQDVTAGKVVFDITYDKFQTAVILNTGKLTEVHFLYSEINIWKGNNMSSEKEIVLYATGGLSPQILSGKYFTYKFFEDDKESTNVKVKQLGSTERQLIYVDGEVKGTNNVLKVYKPSEPTTALDEMKINITTDDLGATINEDSSATVTVKKGTKITDNGVASIPEYIYSDGASHKVSTINTDGMPKDVATLIIPSTVTAIGKGAFNYAPKKEEADGWVPLNNIYYMGTSEQWAEVSGGSNWQGKFAMGVYCSEDSKFVNFSNCLNSKFDAACKEWENKPILLAENAIGGALAGWYSIKLDYSLITGSENNPKDFTNITIYNNASLPIGTLNVTVYLNGYEATENTDYKIIDDEGRFGKTIQFITEKVTLDSDTKITLELKTPTFSKGSVYIGAHKAA